MGRLCAVSITSWKQSGTTLDLEIQNNGVDALTLTGISMDGTDALLAPTALQSGERRLVTLSLGTACGPAGVAFSHQNVVLTYTKGTISGKTQTGSRPMMGRCS